MNMPIERISGFNARDCGCNILNSGRTGPGELNALFLSINSLWALSIRPCHNCSTGAIGQEESGRRCTSKPLEPSRQGENSPAGRGCDH